MKLYKTEEGKIVAILLFVFIISLIPIVAISFYAVPAYDDFNHSVDVYKAIQNGASLIDVLIVAFERVKHMYFTWQGTYSAIFLSALQPGIFNQNLYFLTPIILIGTLICSNMIACKWLFRTFLKLSTKYSWLIIAIVLSFLQIQYLPSAQEGFFWWSGGIMHTFSFSLFLLQLVCFFKACCRKKPKIMDYLMFLLISFIVGGGAHEIALASFTAIAGSIMLMLLNNRFNKIHIQRNKIIFLFYSLTIVILFLAINVAAPGNSLRTAEYGVKVSAVLAILESFIYSTVHVFEYTSLATILIALLIFYFSFPSIKKKNGKIIHPALIFLITFCIYSSLFTPAIYGENYVASPRYLNVLYFSFYWFMITNLVFITFYFKDNKQLNNFYNLLNDVFSKKTLVTTLLILFLMGSSILQFSYVDSTSSSALIDLLLGNAKAFKSINDERFELLLDESKKDISLPNYEKIVRVFYYDDFDKIPHQGKNEIYEKYFDKNSIISSEK
ncbi:MAG: hypothetical protein RR738_01710 [Anaerorhabdus sp.]|uniref:DUF6056 family protein n=1 Tax=Anaerorhabdus sp. TaxID=1872524 RepID=UPI002FC7A076